MPATPRKKRHVPTGAVALAPAVAAFCGAGWTWAVALLATRQHLPGNYGVLQLAPPAWGFLGLPALTLLVVAGVGLLLATAAMHTVRASGRFWSGPVPWLACTWLIPAVDLLRLAGAAIAGSFLEPIIVAGATGGAAYALVRQWPDAPLERWLRRAPWLAIVWLATAGAAAWWYFDAQRAYDSFLLGYNDFGHFGFRVANTWNGRGFLLETPSLPAFWDHFNPGLALLAPLWGLWPDPRLFLLVQAVCLALPAPAVFGIARRLAGEQSTVAQVAAACWAGAYLVFPAVGQFNLAYTYGWHPVTLGLPLMFLAIYCLLRGWRLSAAAAAVLACSFREDIVAILTCLALAMALAAWRNRRREGAAAGPGRCQVASMLGARVWLTVGVVLAAAFVAIFELAPYSRYQVGRFSNLGQSPGEIVLSPILRAEVFWGTLLRQRCGYFLLALMVPLGVRSLVRGWAVLLAATVPLGVLLAWNHAPATSLAFHYATGLVPLLFLAAMTGGAAADAPSAPCGGQWGLWCAGMAALAAGATASAFFGSMPWSNPTLTDVVARSYSDLDDRPLLDDRRPGSPGHRVLSEAVAHVRQRQSSVLATGRIAAHLIAVRRIDTVGQAAVRWGDFARESGPGRSPIELFDWIVIDTLERFYQSPEEVRFIITEAGRANYELVRSERGVLVLRRPEKERGGR